jgi:hypothetical protein
MARISESAPIMSDDERSIATIGDDKDEAKEPEGAMNVLTLSKNHLCTLLAQRSAAANYVDRQNCMLLFQQC